jgi:hypothetical protein
MTRMHHLVVSAAMVVTAVGLLAACGGSIKQTQKVTTYSTNGQTTATVSTRTPPSKREIMQAKGCLKQEHVRPARHTPDRQQVPHGATEVTRNGLPMTPEEYEATVRRCLARTKSASASTRRK